MTSEGSNGMIGRMIRASRLDVHVFEEVEADKLATRQAFLVVLLVGVATGIATGSLGLTGSIDFFTIALGVVISIVGWALWAWIVYLVGTKILPTEETHADWGQLARTLGFAQSAGILKILGIIPVVGIYIFMLVHLWMLIAMVIAVRQALDYTSTIRAVGVVLLGFIPYAVLMSVAFSLTGG